MTPPKDKATAALARLVARQVDHDARDTQARDREPFAGADIEGFVDRGDLGRAERRAFLGLLPRRTPGNDLGRLDEQIGELEQRHRATLEEVSDLRQRLASAPTALAQALAEWEINLRKGDRPAPQGPALEVQLADAEATRDGLTRAIETVLEEKVVFVERNRARLVADADREVDAAHQHMITLIDELQAARAELVTRRSVALWARLYPDQSAAHEPQFPLLATGLARPVQAAIGQPLRLEAHRVLALLREDAAHVRDAITAQQRAAIAGRDPNRPDPANANWVDTDEGREADRAEKKAALRRYNQEWGVDPR